MLEVKGQYHSSNKLHIAYILDKIQRIFSAECFALNIKILFIFILLSCSVNYNYFGMELDKWQCSIENSFNLKIMYAHIKEKNNVN